MNDNLKRLMSEAGFAAPELAGRANKLAELIVRECASIDFRHKVGLSSNDDFEISKVIKEHFGVE